ncbi:MAG: DNA repair protein RecO [Gloeomargaritaceae cyanobacterium C42_A2020_066]|nr:DNA repair protein RecO [Gloeomargaritaceae cyanobacterium C42_A2020_066]
MASSYQVTGLVLHWRPLGEADRLLTVLTQERGLRRLVAPSARKTQSPLAGRTDLFVLNTLQVRPGRSLDRILQADTLGTFPGLIQDLARLSAAQYLGELALWQALEDQDQTELLHLFLSQLRQLERVPVSQTLPVLVDSVVSLLRAAGLVPQVESCCLRGISLDRLDWTNCGPAGFSPALGGVVAPPLPAPDPHLYPLSRSQVHLLQALVASQPCAASLQTWHGVESILRRYAEYHFERPLRSARLLSQEFSQPPDPTLLSLPA